MPRNKARGSAELALAPGARGLDSSPATLTLPHLFPKLPRFRRIDLSIAVALALIVGCGKGDSQVPAASAPGSGTATSPPVPAGSGSATGSGGSAESANDYVPAEFKAGMSRWKDTGVYLDGKPIGFIQFGELPVALKPTWIKDKVSVDKPADCPIEKCPGWKWSRHRTYKFTDYLKAIGVDIPSIKMLHVYGPKLSETIAVTGRDLMSKAAADFSFRFGALVSGKTIPHVPPNFGNGRSPDKMTSVMIYITKKPPIITRDGIELDGVPQIGVPYYGEPLRGGVRIYLDDHLVAIIKRQELDTKKATQRGDGELYWSFADFLRGNAVDTGKVVEGWIIRDDRRAEPISWSDLSKMEFSAGSKARGGVLLGDKALRANAIALHTRHISKDELPVIDPEEE